MFTCSGCMHMVVLKHFHKLTLAGTQWKLDDWTLGELKQTCTHTSEVDSASFVTVPYTHIVRLGRMLSHEVLESYRAKPKPSVFQPRLQRSIAAKRNTPSSIRSCLACTHVQHVQGEYKIV